MTPSQPPEEWEKRFISFVHENCTMHSKLWKYNKGETIALFRDFIRQERERAREEEREAIVEEISKWAKSWGAIPTTDLYAQGWNGCRKELFGGYKRLINSLTQETKETEKE